MDTGLFVSDLTGVQPHSNVLLEFCSNNTGDWRFVQCVSTDCLVGERYDHVAGKCMPCPMGTELVGDRCVNCAPGRFKALADRSQCSLCASGTIQLAE
eukprot:6903207-Prymnesium_polylepis.3